MNAQRPSRSPPRAPPRRSHSPDVGRHGRPARSPPRERPAPASRKRLIAATTRAFASRLGSGAAQTSRGIAKVARYTGIGAAQTSRGIAKAARYTGRKAAETSRSIKEAVAIDSVRDVLSPHAKAWLANPNRGLRYLTPYEVQHVALKNGRIAEMRENIARKESEQMQRLARLARKARGDEPPNLM